MCKDADNVDVNLIELDFLITVNKLEEDMKIEDVENPKTKIVTRAISDSYAR